MSVLIEGMEMPKNCEIIIRIDEKGEVYVYGQYPTRIYKAIPVTPHGRLIDADELEKKFCSHCDDYMSGKDECKEGCFDLKIIKSMPTVIPADKDGEP